MSKGYNPPPKENRPRPKPSEAPPAKLGNVERQDRLASMIATLLPKLEALKKAQDDLRKSFAGFWKKDLSAIPLGVPVFLAVYSDSLIEIEAGADSPVALAPSGDHIGSPLPVCIGVKFEAAPFVVCWAKIPWPVADELIAAWALPADVLAGPKIEIEGGAE